MWNYRTSQVYKNIYIYIKKRMRAYWRDGWKFWTGEMDHDLLLLQEWNWSFGFMSEPKKSECVDAFDRFRRWGSSAGQFQKSFYCNVMKIVWPPPSSTFQVYYWFWLCTLLLGIGSAGGVRAAPSQILWCRFWWGGVTDLSQMLRHHLPHSTLLFPPTDYQTAVAFPCLKTSQAAPCREAER